MIEERDPVRLTDALETDPALRRAIMTARATPGAERTAALIERIEQAAVGPAPLRLHLSRRWLVPIGLAAAVIGVSASRFLPAADSGTPTPTATRAQAATDNSEQRPVAQDGSAARPDNRVAAHDSEQLRTGAQATRAAAQATRAAAQATGTAVREGPAQPDDTGHARTATPDAAAPRTETRHLDTASARALALKARARLGPRAQMQRPSLGSEPPQAEPAAPPGSASAAQPASENQTVAAQPQSSGAAPRQTRLMPELQLLAAAQRALQSAPARALALTDQHAEAYPSGRFSQEREEIAIEALLALGQSEAGQARARKFLARYPSSTHARRVAQLLSAAP